MVSKAELLEFRRLIHDLKIGKFGTDNILSFYPHITENQKRHFLQYFDNNTLGYIKNPDGNIKIPNEVIGQIKFHNFALGYLARQYKEWEQNFSKIFPKTDRYAVVTKYGPLGCVFHTDIAQKRAAEEAHHDILSISNLGHHAVFKFKPVSPIFGTYTKLVTKGSLEPQDILLNRNAMVSTIKSNTILDIVRSFLDALVKLLSLIFPLDSTRFEKKTKLKKSPHISPLILDPSYLLLDPREFHQAYLCQQNELRNTGIDSAHRKTDLRDVGNRATKLVPNTIFQHIVYREPQVSFSNVARILNNTQDFLDKTDKKLGIDLNPIKESLYRVGAKIKFSHSETIVDGKHELFDPNLRKFCSGATRHSVNEIILPGFQNPKFLSAVLIHEIGHIVSHEVSNYKLESLGNKAKSQLMKYVVNHNLEIDALSMAAHAKAFQNPDYHKGKDWFATLIGILPAITPNEKFCNDFKDKNNPELKDVREFTQSMMDEISKIKTQDRAR